jgi:hypothetical protein
MIKTIGLATALLVSSLPLAHAQGTSGPNATTSDTGANGTLHKGAGTEEGRSVNSGSTYSNTSPGTTGTGSNIAGGSSGGPAGPHSPGSAATTK